MKPAAALSVAVVCLLACSQRGEVLPEKAVNQVILFDTGWRFQPGRQLTLADSTYARAQWVPEGTNPFPIVSISIRKSYSLSLAFRMEDKGSCITEQKTEKLLQPFFTNKPRGKGRDWD